MCDAKRRLLFLFKKTVQVRSSRIGFLQLSFVSAGDSQPPDGVLRLEVALVISPLVQGSRGTSGLTVI